MTCPQCGQAVEAPALFCPSCGHKLANPFAAQPRLAMLPDDIQATRILEPSPPAPARRGCRHALAVLGVALVAVLIVIGLGAVAVYAGLRDRSRVERQAAQEHYLKGEIYLAEGQMELAIAELEAAVNLDPRLDQAQTKLQEALQARQEQPSPSPVLQLGERETLYAAVVAAGQAQDWLRLLAEADRLYALDPAYKRDQVQPLQVEAYRQLAAALVQQDRLAEALAYYDRALELAPEDAELSRARELAALYLQAMGYWGADWAGALEQLNRLYRLEPGYKDVAARIPEAYLAYANGLSQAGDWCQAEKMYTAALQARDTEATRASRDQAALYCKKTPAAAPGKPGVQAPSGAYVGRVDRVQDAGSNKVFIRGRVLSAKGAGVPNVRVKIQAWDWFVFATTDGVGQFSFDGLRDPVTYTLSLPDVTFVPVDVKGEAGKIGWVLFEEAK